MLKFTGAFPRLADSRFLLLTTLDLLCGDRAKSLVRERGDLILEMTISCRLATTADR